MQVLVFGLLFQIHKNFYEITIRYIGKRGHTKSKFNLPNTVCEYRAVFMCGVPIQINLTYARKQISIPSTIPRRAIKSLSIPAKRTRLAGMLN